MKIVRTIDSFYPHLNCNIEQAYRISKGLVDKGIKSPVFTKDDKFDGFTGDENFYGVDVKRFKKSIGFMSFLYTPDIMSALIDEKPDIIHAHGYRGYIPGVSYKVSKKLNIPFVLNTHGELLNYGKISGKSVRLPYRAFDYLRKKIIIEASAVVVSSTHEKQAAVDLGISENKIYVIPAGIDFCDYDSTKGRRKRNDGIIRILLSGNLLKNNNLMPILEAIKQISPPEIELRVLLNNKNHIKINDEYLVGIKSYAEKNDIKVSFSDNLQGKEEIIEYIDSDFFISTPVSGNEDFQLLQAAASALPVISTPVGLAGDVITQDKTGYIIDFEELKHPVYLGERIKRLQDIKKRKEFGSKIKKIIQSNYQWDDIIMEYEKMYLKISGK